MSFLSRSKPTDDTNIHNDETEMTQIIDLNSFMTLMDSRNSLEHFTQHLQDDNSSMSSEDTLRINSKEEEPHVFYQYSSDDEEDAHFQGDDEAEQSLVGRDIEAIGTSKNMDNTIRRKGKKWICLGFFILLLLIWLIWTIGLSQMGPSDDQSEQVDTLKHVDLPDLFNSSFMVKRPSLVWVKNDPRDGIYTYRDQRTHDILLESIEDGKTEIFSDLLNHTRITFDGSATIFNGVPDWVYEEEVFSKDSALWWSPDSTHLAYLRLNETAVPEFHLQMYTNINATYPEEVAIKYPKAGAPNPLASLHLYSLTLDTNIMLTSNSTTKATAESKVDEFKDDDRIITDVTWATENHTYLLFKQTNRVQDIELTSLVGIDDANLNKSTISSVRTYKPEDGGWVDSAQTMVYIPNSKSTDKTVRYLDVIDDGEGFMHLAVLNQNGQAKWLTSGEWEVIAGSVIVDQSRRLIHYMSTERSHLERHLYRIDLNNSDPSSTKTCLTCPEDPEVHAYYKAAFSPKNGYYILEMEGPGIPTASVRKVDEPEFDVVIQNNTELKELLSGYELPRTRFVNVKSGGVNMEAMEVLPPDFDVSKKYPVLFHVYGGPGSQLASYEFDISWSTFLASKLGYIVVTVDGRGTGFKGRKYRVGVRGRLGELEAIDQINAARHWSTLEYVDPSRIAIWGWSYGGYMTTKVVEANSGLFAAGLAVAPVTDWRFYDSIYTERYMLTPEMNADGYKESAINNMTGFENTRYLLAHGTGDDNVHFQHSAVLVDKLTKAEVHNYQVQFFPDSNHAIRHHNANYNLYYLLTKFLWESFGGEEYSHVRKELNGHFSGPITGGH
ncbi:hypothetical protein K501DRAFT_282328 [Backusella circina FSU 941]|nr:hypothetical protein K501DRAFT_282328 [Backusella circina FSU 941]